VIKKLDRGQTLSDENKTCVSIVFFKIKQEHCNAVEEEASGRLQCCDYIKPKELTHKPLSQHEKLNI